MPTATDVRATSRASSPIWCNSLIPDLLVYAVSSPTCLSGRYTTVKLHYTAKFELSRIDRCHYLYPSQKWWLKSEKNNHFVLRAQIARSGAQWLFRDYARKQGYLWLISISIINLYKNWMLQLMREIWDIWRTCIAHHSDTNGTGLIDIDKVFSGKNWLTQAVIASKLTISVYMTFITSLP